MQHKTDTHLRDKIVRKWQPLQVCVLKRKVPAITFIKNWPQKTSEVQGVLHKVRWNQQVSLSQDTLTTTHSSRGNERPQVGLPRNLPQDWSLSLSPTQGIYYTMNNKTQHHVYSLEKAAQLLQYHYVVNNNIMLHLNISFRLTAHQIPIVHKENALTSMPYSYHSQRWPRISLLQYLHACLTHRGPTHSLTAVHSTCSSFLSFFPITNGKK